MRMMKRVAASILAAAMALSLMTACGGGDAPSAPETPSNPGTSQGTGNGNSGNSGNNGDNNSNKEPDQEDENKLPTSWNASKTKAYYNTKGISNTNIYVNGAFELPDIAYCGTAPVFQEKVRTEICTLIKRYFDGSTLLGWFYDEKRTYQ